MDVEMYRKGFQEKCAQRQWDIGPLSVSWGKPPPPPVPTMNDRVARVAGHMAGGGFLGAIGGSTAGGLIGRHLAHAKGGKIKFLASLIGSLVGAPVGGAIGGGVHGINEFGFNHGIGKRPQ